MVVHTCNLSTLAEAGGSQGQEIETILVNMTKPHLYKKYRKQKIAGHEWCVPIVPSTWGTEAGGSLECQWLRLQ